MDARIIKGRQEHLGWRELFQDSPQAHLGIPNSRDCRALLTLVHISDTHICDAQSPARVEFLDRFADPHHPLSQKIGGLVGTYRAQEILTVQVLDSLIRKINRIEHAPILGMPIQTVLVTGDVTDNAQSNELDWFLALMNGGFVTPDSGNRSRWEGVGGDHYSPHYWNPHGTPTGELDDYPRALYGFPVIPELLNAARTPFEAEGLQHPWLAVHGNHDSLLQGTVRPNLYLTAIAMGARKFYEMNESEALETLLQMREVGPADYPKSTVLPNFEVTPDPQREFVNEWTWGNVLPTHGDGHGFTDSHRGAKEKFWRKDFESISLIALDTVNPHGGWQGSIDIAQFDWLREQLEISYNRYVVITSHHPLQDLFNDYTPGGATPRVSRKAIEELLVKYPHVILWLAGHTHRNKIQYFGKDLNSGFWQIETASLVDWPQQGRIIEIFSASDGSIGIASTTLEHDGSVGVIPSKISLDSRQELAGLSRLLSVNDWQRRSGKFAIDINEGTDLDQNVILTLPRRIASLIR